MKKLIVSVFSDPWGRRGEAQTPQNCHLSPFGFFDHFVTSLLSSFALLCHGGSLMQQIMQHSISINNAN